MSSAKQSQGVALSQPRTYLQTRLIRSLSTDADGSFFEVSICYERTELSAGPETNSGSCLTNTVRESAVQRHICTVNQLRQVINLNLRVTYLITIRQSNSLSKLSINRDLLCSLIEHCGLSFKLCDFIAFFGPRHGETPLSPPVTWTELNVLDGEVRLSLCIYALRLPEDHGRAESNPFTLRQFLVYYQRSADSPAAFLISTGTALSAQRCLSVYGETQGSIHQQFRRIHLELLETAVSAWRPYISHLSERIDEQSDLAITADLDEDSVEHATLETRQFLKQLEDMLAEATLNISHTVKTAKALQRHCQNMSRTSFQNGSSNTSCHHESVQCAEAFDHIVNSLDSYLEQSETLKHKVKSTSQLVSNILELNNSNTLKLLALKAADEGVTMQELTKKATQDAAAVKILTVLTLIYLPSTVVMNFFSTSFVNTEITTSGQPTLTVASNWWIAIAATVPLTIITLYVWWLYVQRELRGEWPVTWKKCTQMASELKLRFVRARQAKSSAIEQAPWDTSLLEARVRHDEAQSFHG